MNYIKKFESLGEIYHKDDLVLLNYSSDTQFLYPFAKIIARFKPKQNQHPIDRYYVEVLFPNPKHWTYDKLTDTHTTYIEDYGIIRKTTLKEIEEFKIKMEVNKYNL